MLKKTRGGTCVLPDGLEETEHSSKEPLIMINMYKIAPERNIAVTQVPHGV